MQEKKGKEKVKSEKYLIRICYQNRLLDIFVANVESQTAFLMLEIIGHKCNCYKRVPPRKKKKKGGFIIVESFAFNILQENLVFNQGYA